ncbi:MAG: phosphoesterase [Lachnospiraceae bacterium]|nr:phosphoesterase [Lachnospiraceae bacterium]
MEKWKDFYRRYPQCWVLLYLFIYIPWFILLERRTSVSYTVLHTGWDDAIPFCEYFIIPYYIWYLYFAGTAFYFLFRRPRKEFYEFAVLVASGMTFWLLLCTIWPNGLVLRPAIEPERSFCARLVSLIYAADTPTNVFPSMHVYVSIVAHSTIRRNLRKSYPGGTVFSGVLMVLICVSTVFVKQHSVLDVAGGILLFALLAPVVYHGGREKR